MHRAHAMLIRIFVATALTVAVAACALKPHEYPDLAAPGTAAFNPVSGDHPVIGLVLGAGGARGFAHVGVIKELEAAGIHPQIDDQHRTARHLGELVAASSD
jgi:NTE family protein